MENEVKIKKLISLYEEGLNFPHHGAYFDKDTKIDQKYSLDEWRNHVEERNIKWMYNVLKLFNKKSHFYFLFMNPRPGKLYTHGSDIYREEQLIILHNEINRMLYSS